VVGTCDVDLSGLEEEEARIIAKVHGDGVTGIDQSFLFFSLFSLSWFSRFSLFSRFSRLLYFSYSRYYHHPFTQET